MSANLNITYPKVSICMPTYNRNEFLPLMIQNLKGFVYPDKSLLEWVIDDDGTESYLKMKHIKKK
jgi:glycosyltransferase involved in cell wall biosynthesis